MLIRALTSYILEVTRGKVPEIIFARICNLFAKSLCAYTSRRRCFALLIQFCKVQGEHISKVSPCKSVGVSTPGVPGPTSKLSLRVPAQMGRREMEHKGETTARVILCPGRMRLQ